MEGKINLFALISRRMDWLSQRQRVLAHNIANSDTPDFVPRDLDEKSFKRILGRRLAPVNPTATHGRHLPGTPVRGGPARS